VLVSVAVAVLAGRAVSTMTQAQAPSAGGLRLAVIWSSADPDVAKRVCFMYMHAAKRQEWFDEVTLIV
jgi:hypothetical protein